jgi:hypothetical protein
MFHAYVQTFDVTGNLENFWELNIAFRFGIAMTFDMPVSAVAVTPWWWRQGISYGD